MVISRLFLFLTVGIYLAVTRSCADSGLSANRGISPMSLLGAGRREPSSIKVAIRASAVLTFSSPSWVSSAGALWQWCYGK